MKLGLRKERRGETYNNFFGGYDNFVLSLVFCRVDSPNSNEWWEMNCEHEWKCFNRRDAKCEKCGIVQPISFYWDDDVGNDLIKAGVTIQRLTKMLRTMVDYFEYDPTIMGEKEIMKSAEDLLKELEEK